MAAESAPPDVAGICLDGREPITISAAENRALCESMGVAPAADGSAHPSYYYAATQVGMGLSVAELCARCDFDVNDGPMLASSEARFLGPLRTGTPYRVRGEILGLTRKNSRKLGTMDVLDYRLRLVDADGLAVVETVNVWVLPRGAS
jgi:acyl dehydratase